MAEQWLKPPSQHVPLKREGVSLYREHIPLKWEDDIKKRGGDMKKWVSVSL
jgi:hypothetical protein